MIPPTFKCGGCGGDTYIEPDEGPAICAECCGKSEDGHQFEYERAERQWLCVRCNELAPPDWGQDDEGYGLGAMFRHGEPSGPIGTPLSELAGRPDGTREGQRRYDEFKRIAASWGYD